MLTSLQKIKNDNDFTEDLKIPDLVPNLSLPIIYSFENPEIPREHMLRFFTTCSALMAEDSTVESIVQKSMKTNMGIERVNVEFQTDVMEKMLQIEKVFGCRYMGDLPENRPDDTELLEAGKRFTYSTLKCFIAALKLRFKKNGSKLRKSGGMSRTTIFEFFEACNATSK